MKTRGKRKTISGLIAGPEAQIRAMSVSMIDQRRPEVIVTEYYRVISSLLYRGSKYQIIRGTGLTWNIHLSEQV